MTGRLPSRISAVDENGQAASSTVTFAGSGVGDAMRIRMVAERSEAAAEWTRSPNTARDSNALNRLMWSSKML